MVVRLPRLAALFALTLGAAGTAESAVIRMSTIAETGVVADQVRIRLTTKNDGSAPALDIRPYLQLRHARLGFAPKRRLDPGESYARERQLPLSLAAAGGFQLPVQLAYSDSVGKRSFGLLLAAVRPPTERAPPRLQLSLSPKRAWSEPRAPS